METETIHSLRKKGFKVRVTHYRFKRNAANFPMIVSIKEDNSNVWPTGGKTRIEITTPTGRDVMGESVCSLKDNYNHRVGNSLALKRALTHLSSEEI